MSGIQESRNLGHVPVPAGTLLRSVVGWQYNTLYDNRVTELNYTPFTLISNQDGSFVTRDVLRRFSLLGEAGDPPLTIDQTRDITVNILRLLSDRPLGNTDAPTFLAVHQHLAQLPSIQSYYFQALHRPVSATANALVSVNLGSRRAVVDVFKVDKISQSNVVLHLAMSRGLGGNWNICIDLVNWSQPDAGAFGKGLFQCRNELYLDGARDGHRWPGRHGCRLEFGNTGERDSSATLSRMKLTRDRSLVLVGDSCKIIDCPNAYQVGVNEPQAEVLRVAYYDRGEINTCKWVAGIGRGRGWGRGV
ncbi:hypothetical protein I302_100491 [Kwoniella bestiolae CBS 10118]|uniref:Uncharacterized protein n=1 Tax=Kwoniella bestiolae CBS 10118 TaxID=1296100 RepID=A0A1B9G588_9TREE|nr:hypothetical protein I302_03864 [Kwoniella bestiolae CBS 10118]OCF26186.1 hypothetical protein I302_03864 [Kwoniella bestiolae CBS 10118]